MCAIIECALFTLPCRHTYYNVNLQEALRARQHGRNSMKCLILFHHGDRSWKSSEGYELAAPRPPKICIRQDKTFSMYCCTLHIHIHPKGFMYLCGIYLAFKVEIWEPILPPSILTILTWILWRARDLMTQFTQWKDNISRLRVWGEVQGLRF